MKKSFKDFLLLLLLAVITVCTYSVMTQWSRGFSVERLGEIFRSADKLWLTLAAVCAFGFIWFEGAALRCSCAFLGSGFSRGRAVLFSASDIYFSAITPSAAGGQPAALIMMMRRGIPAAVAALALLLNLVMYTLAIVLLSLICFILRPGLLLGLDAGSTVFVLIGAVLQLGFIALFVLCILNDRLVLRVCDLGLRLCCRVRLLRDYDSQYEKLCETVTHYRECGVILRRETALLSRVFLLNLLQRLSVVSVAVCVFLAVGGVPGKALDAFCAQTFAVLGSNAAPVPGAVGIVDYIFIDGFEGLISDPMSLGMISRGFSFYATFVFCAVLMFIDFIKRKIKKE